MRNLLGYARALLGSYWHLIVPCILETNSTSSVEDFLSLNFLVGVDGSSLDYWETTYESNDL